jgi:hypothetical protein
MIPDGVVGPSVGFDYRRKCREHIRTKHAAVAKCAYGSQYRQSQHGHCDDETTSAAPDNIEIVIRVMTYRSGLDIRVVAVFGRGGQEYRCSSIWRNRRLIISVR